MNATRQPAKTITVVLLSIALLLISAGVLRAAPLSDYLTRVSSAITLIEEVRGVYEHGSSSSSPEQVVAGNLALVRQRLPAKETIKLDGQTISVRGDPRLLRRMIRNLLENAKRHGAPPIEVRVSLTAEGAELSVCDGGAGIPDSESERVFEPFYRAGARPGAGLGLALVRQIARRHGGEAHVRGSCFIVALPLES